MAHLESRNLNLRLQASCELTEILRLQASCELTEIGSDFVPSSSLEALSPPMIALGGSWHKLTGQHYRSPPN